MLFKRLIAIAFLTGTVATVAASAALAEPPTRVPAPSPDFTGRYCADFDVLVHPAINKETATIFSDGRVIITGTFTVDLTNLASNKTITVNASGPVFFSSDGSVGVFGGRTLLFGEAGTFGPNPELSLQSGVVTITFTPTGGIASITRTGHADDLCSLLADP
jgi:hypothetical protein